MKLFEIAQEIDERKNIGNLYHFTTYEGMFGILSDGLKLQNKHGTITDKGNEFISFTRDMRMESDSIPSQVRIKIDGTILSDRYQVKPYADIKSGYGRTTQDEKEERALVKKKDGYVDISGCILQILIKNIESITQDDNDWEYEVIPLNNSKYEQLLELLPKTGIPFGVINKY